ALATLIAARARYSADLSALLPRHASAGEQALLEQVRSGPAARLLIAAVRGADPDTRAHVALAMGAALRGDSAFVSVSNGDSATLTRDREFLFAHRYALSPDVNPERFSVPGLHAAVADSIEALASPEGMLLKPLFSEDPTGELLG